jgi:hypothetical protein
MLLHAGKPFRRSAPENSCILTASLMSEGMPPGRHGSKYRGIRLLLGISETSVSGNQTRVQQHEGLKRIFRPAMFICSTRPFLLPTSVLGRSEALR